MGLNEKFFKTAAAPTDSTYFGTELYSNANPATATFNFAPDFFWIKSRGGNYGHMLFDRVRGIDQPNDYYLSTNATDAQVTSTNRFSLSADGKTMTIRAHQQ